MSTVSADKTLVSCPFTMVTVLVQVALTQFAPPSSEDWNVFPLREIRTSAAPTKANSVSYRVAWR